ncbi:UNVERIFIED_CONTAM: GDP-mannose 3,5-epimerase 1 [Sesamum calycinum]|uniref:GDP-mannose 3,5-epimerase 1 n=1 Tax=Sesamum calycinum TaxID=2727403 RepID=A0AAW2L8Z5_9LAMI
MGHTRMKTLKGNPTGCRKSSGFQYRSWWIYCFSHCQAFEERGPFYYCFGLEEKQANDRGYLVMNLVDLMMDYCLKVTKGVDHMFNLSADMGGMGFIQSNHPVIMYNNTMISFDIIEAARINGVKRDTDMSGGVPHVSTDACARNLSTTKHNQTTLGIDGC